MRVLLSNHRVILSKNQIPDGSGQLTFLYTLLKYSFSHYGERLHGTVYQNISMTCSIQRLSTSSNRWKLSKINLLHLKLKVKVTDVQQKNPKKKSWVYSMFEWFIFTIDKIDLLLSSVNLDNPKSVNLIFPSLEIRRLSGLRSLKLCFEKEL